MIIGEPWGLLALAGVPAIIALHLWRTRHAPLPVSGLFLWPAERRVLASGRTRAPLVLRPSFWCEVLAVLAATWWLADIHLTPRTAARHLVIVLDDRWRLQAVVGGDSAAARLRTALDQRLAALAAGDRATLIATGTPPRLLAGPAAEPAAARTALAAWRPQAGWHDADAALTLAAGLGGAGAEVVLASDRIPPLLPDGVGAIATGRTAPTSGLAEARWWREGGERIVAVVHGDQTRVPQLSLAGVTVAGTSPQPGLHVFDRLPPLAEGATAELSLPGEDPLPLDDRVELVRPPPRTVRLRTALDGALGASVRAAATAAGAQPATGEADIVVGADGSPGCWSLRIVAGDGEPTLGPFTGRRDHPLMADLDFHGVLWSGGAAEVAGAPLLLAGGRLLLADHQRGADHDLVLHVDAAKSNLVRHTAWPALFANLVAWRAAQLTGVADPNPRAGAQLSARVPARAERVELVDPDGLARVLRPAADGALVVPGLPRPGRWHLRWDGADAAVNVLPLDPRQGDLAAATTGERAAVIAGQAAVERLRSPLASLLPLLVAALAALAAWASFAREERS
jgi:hypothetical protein